MTSLLPASKGSFADSDASNLSLAKMSSYTLSTLTINDDLDFGADTDTDDRRSSVSKTTDPDLAPVLTNDALQEKLAQVEMDFTSFIYNEGILDSITEEFGAQYTKALSKSSISMLPCFNFITTGKEAGRYLSLDLGGSTLRVSVITVDGSTRAAQVLVSQKFNIPDSQKVINDAFFDWIASRINSVLFEDSQRLPSALFDKAHPIKTGITWSFPLIQTSSSDGVINKCGKGYSLSQDMLDRSLKRLFQSSCWQQHRIRLDVLSLVNDSVSVYLSAKFFNHYTSMGVVLGTGANCCLLLPTKLLTSEHKQHANSGVLRSNDHDMCLFNTELSFFGEHLRPYMTQYDHAVHTSWKLGSQNDQGAAFNDAFVSNNFNDLYQPLEFLTSGRYVSELVRLVVVDFVQQGLILGGAKLGSKLFTKFDYFTGEVCSVLSNSEDLDTCKKYFFQQFVERYSSGGETSGSMLVTDEDILALKRIIHAVADRAAAVLACALLSLEKLLSSHDTVSRSLGSSLTSSLSTLTISRQKDPLAASGKKISNIGYGGSVLKHFHYYRDKVDYFLALLDPATDHRLEFVNDSSIYGAAISAAINDIV